MHKHLFIIEYVDPTQMIDYDAARSRLRKLIDKPSEDPTKLPRAQQEHDDAKEVFDMLNDQLIAELPQLLDLRVPFFDPSFEAMIRMQCKFAEEGYEKMSGVQRYFEDSVRDDYAAGQLDAQVSWFTGFWILRGSTTGCVRSRESCRR
jgi:bridging integrator 3